MTAVFPRKGRSSDAGSELVGKGSTSTTLASRVWTCLEFGLISEEAGIVRPPGNEG